VAYKSPDRRFVERHTGAPVRTATVDFRHKSWSRGEFATKPTTHSTSSPQRIKGTKSGVYTPESRAWNTPRSGGRSERHALNARPHKPQARQFRAEESRRVASTRQALSPRRADRESRAVRAERPAKQFIKGPSAREPRSIQRPQRAERPSRAAMQTSRGSGERRSVVMERRSLQRDVAKTRRAESNGKGRGKAK
jgi:hypothetical protein